MDLFLPAEARRNILRAYGHRYGLNVFIETGTNDGGTPMALKDDFKLLFTIELSPQLFAAAVQTFKPYPQVECMEGDSTTVLSQILSAIKEPALVWLDAHHCGPGSAHGALSTPIREELQVLLGDGRPHVILVDDARIFDGQPEHEMYDHYADYPTLEWVQEYAAEYGYSYRLEHDIVRLVPGRTL